MKTQTIIRDFYGKKLGTVITDEKGNKEVRNFYGKIVSRYDSKQDVTRDFYGKIVSKGDTSISLLYQKR